MRNKSVSGHLAIGFCHWAEGVCCVSSTGVGVVVVYVVCEFWGHFAMPVNGPKVKARVDMVRGIERAEEGAVREGHAVAAECQRYAALQRYAASAVAPDRKQQEKVLRLRNVLRLKYEGRQKQTAKLPINTNTNSVGVWEKEVSHSTPVQFAPAGFHSAISVLGTSFAVPPPAPHREFPNVSSKKRLNLTQHHVSSQHNAIMSGS